MKKSRFFTASFLFLVPFSLPVFAAGHIDGNNPQMTDIMAQLIMQLGVIVLAARVGGLLFEKIRVPSVLGELCLGMLIGPYLLGRIPFIGFPHGLFPISDATVLPVSPELYAIATIASIILIFVAGLETDLALFMKFSLVGFAVGFGGAVVSFLGGAFTGSLFFGLPFSNPNVLFLGVMVASTSIGITARILSEKRKMDSPEGVTILAGAVTDDVLGIAGLTVIVGFLASSAGGEGGSNSHVASVVLKAVLVGAGFTAVVILFANPISRVMKRFKTVGSISIFALGLALVAAGIFQMAGLAMIIGAYAVGLSLSKTDLSDTVRDSTEVLYNFFVPVFFVVMGMLVDLGAFMNKEVIIFGLIYSAVAIAAKIVGCGATSMFFNFNRVGALRIGMGMVPRGEANLIIAGIGLSTHLLESKYFAAAVLAVFVTVLISPPFISTFLRSDKRGTKKAVMIRDTVSTLFNFDCPELTGLLEIRLVQSFRSEGFYMHSVFIDNHTIYQLRKDETLITLHAKALSLEFETDVHEVLYVKTVVYEALLQLNETIAKVKNLIKPELLLNGLTDSTGRIDTSIHRTLDPRCIVPSLKSTAKRQVIEELIEVLYKNGMLTDKKNALEAVMERETSMSTGMQHGVALPHGKTDAVDKITVAIGLSRKGIDFQSIDKEVSTIFVLILSPLSSDTPHIQFLANLSAVLNSPEIRAKLMECRDREEIYWFLKRLGSKSGRLLSGLPKS